MGERHTRWGMNIREARKALGMSQWDLARAIYSSQAAVSRWECGTGHIPDDFKVALATTLGVSPALLFAWEVAA